MNDTMERNKVAQFKAFLDRKGYEQTREKTREQSKELSPEEKLFQLTTLATELVQDKDARMWLFRHTDSPEQYDRIMALMRQSARIVPVKWVKENPKSSLKKPVRMW